MSAAWISKPIYVLIFYSIQICDNIWLGIDIGLYI
jgi:hypothetical protein